jgi:hypothetical protein
MIVENFSGFTALVAFVLALGVGALMLFMVVIQPIWCIVDCAVDNRRGTAGKVIWIILLVVLYGLANWIYGAFAAAGRGLRRLTRLAWLVAIALLLAFLFMYWSHDEFRRGIDREWQQRHRIMVLAPADVAPPAREVSV